MKSIILFFTILLIGFNGFAQDTLQKRTPHYFGLHAGSTTAYGLSYRFWPKRLGVEFTTLPTFNQTFTHIENSKFIDSQISTGLCLLYKINQGKIADYYSYFGANTLFKKKHHIEYPTTYPPDYTQQIIVKDENLALNMGLGLGVSIKFLRVMDFNLQLGYGLYNINKTKDFYTFIALEGGLYYRF